MRSRSACRSLATPVGALGELVEADLVERIEAPEAAAVLAAWRRLVATDPAAVDDRRRRAHAFAARHTRPAEAARLVERWRSVVARPAVGALSA